MTTLTIAQAIKIAKKTVVISKCSNSHLVSTFGNDTKCWIETHSPTLKMAKLIANAHIAGQAALLLGAKIPSEARYAVKEMGYTVKGAIIFAL